MKITPNAGKVVVRRSDAEDVTKGGIILPDVAKLKSQKGTILEVGPGKAVLDCACWMEQPTFLRKGDIVCFDPYAGNKIEVDGKELIVLDQESILCTIKE